MNENKNKLILFKELQIAHGFILMSLPFLMRKWWKDMRKLTLMYSWPPYWEIFAPPPPPQKKNVTDPYYTTESFEGNARRGEEACSSFVPSRPQVPEFPPFAINKVGAHNAGRLHRTLLSFVSAFLLFLSLTFCGTRWNEI